MINASMPLTRHLLSLCGIGISLELQAPEDDGQQFVADFRAAGHASADVAGFDQQFFGGGHFHGLNVGPLAVNKNVQGAHA